MKLKFIDESTGNPIKVKIGKQKAHKSIYHFSSKKKKKIPNAPIYVKHGKSIRAKKCNLCGKYLRCVCGASLWIVKKYALNVFTNLALSVLWNWLAWSNGANLKNLINNTNAIFVRDPIIAGCYSFKRGSAIDLSLLP